MPFLNSHEDDDSRYYEILHILIPRFLRVIGDRSDYRICNAQLQLSDRLGPNAGFLSVVRWFHSASFMSLPGYLSINDIDPSSIGLFPLDIASACAVNAMSICGDAESTKILDLCCCPGGKTQMIYDTVENQVHRRRSGRQADVLIVGVDISETRLRVCTSLLNRTARYKAMELSKHRPGAALTDSMNRVQPRRNLSNINNKFSAAEECKTEEGDIVKSAEGTVKPPHLMIFSCDGTKFGEDTMGALVYDSVVQDCELQHIFDKEKRGLILKRNSKLLPNMSPLVADTPSTQSCNSVAEEENGGRKRKNKSARQRENKMLRLIEKNDMALIFSNAHSQDTHATQQESEAEIGQGAAGVEAGKGNNGTEVVLKWSLPLPQPVLDEGTFDFVLVDAECSHDGSYRHMRYVNEGHLDEEDQDRSEDHTSNTPPHAAARPGYSHIKPLTASSYVRASSEEERARIVALQKQLLANGFRLLRATSTSASSASASSPYLVYSTCSLEKSQNEEVVQWLLDTHQDAELCPLELSDLCGRPPLKGENDTSTMQTQSHTAEQRAALRKAESVTSFPLEDSSSGVKDHPEAVATQCEESKEVSEEEEEDMRDLDRALALIALSQPELLQAVEARKYSAQHLHIAILLSRLTLFSHGSFFNFLSPLRHYSTTAAAAAAAVWVTYTVGERQAAEDTLQRYSRLLSKHWASLPHLPSTSQGLCTGNDSSATTQEGTPMECSSTDSHERSKSTPYLAGTVRLSKSNGMSGIFIARFKKNRLPG
jgi:16S rRNA C967 or C1407 C5-methylase (RsmB/RsmF family)